MNVRLTATSNKCHSHLNKHSITLTDRAMKTEGPESMFITHMLHKMDCVLLLKSIVYVMKQSVWTIKNEKHTKGKL